MSSPTYAYDPITRGDSAVIAIQVVQWDILSLETSRVDLTGCTISLEIQGADKSIEASTGAGLIVDPEMSIVSRALSPAQTSALALGTNLGRWKITYPDGRVETFLRFVIPVQD
jgi:hypothetical protein